MYKILDIGVKKNWEIIPLKVRICYYKSLNIIITQHQILDYGESYEI